MILAAICFISILVITFIITLYVVLKKDSNSVISSRNILNKFEPDNISPKLTKMIEFHKQHEELKKYNIN